MKNLLIIVIKSFVFFNVLSSILCASPITEAQYDKMNEEFGTHSSALSIVRYSFVGAANPEIADGSSYQDTIWLDVRIEHESDKIERIFFYAWGNVMEVPYQNLESLAFSEWGAPRVSIVRRGGIYFVVSIPCAALRDENVERYELNMYFDSLTKKFTKLEKK